MTGFAPQFTITHAMTGALTAIERARGFLEAATLSEGLIERMSARALLLEAHHTTHIEGTRLTLVREQDMDLTGWLEYFVKGLATQIAPHCWRLTNLTSKKR